MSALISPRYSSNEKAGNTAELPKHLVSLGNREWAAWRWVALRGAGFPAASVLKFAAPEYAALADRVIEAEDAARRAKEDALEAVRRNLKEADAGERALLNKVKKQIFKGNFSEPLSLNGYAQDLLDNFRATHEQLNSLQLEFSQSHAVTELELAQSIKDVAEWKRFCEAIIWQNRRAYHSGIDPMLRKPITDQSKNRRANQQMVASYLQRYCVKNDTIGFFGPVGWLKLNPQEESITARPGPGLLATRTVYFETWCIDALCDALDKDLSLLPWMAPRLRPHVRLEGNSLHLQLGGFGAPVALPPAQVSLLQACDGERTAKEIARRLMMSHPAQFKREADVYRLLGIVRNMGVIAWAVEVPFGWHPEVSLRRRLEGIGDERLTRKALAALTELEQARAEVAKAAGDAQALDKALDQLDETFTRLTGVTSTRGAGQTYAGRTLAFEDCRRDVDVELGSEVLEELGRPLSLLLTSARWFSNEVAKLYRKVLRGIYDELAQKSGSKVVSGLDLWERAEPLMTSEEIPVLNELIAVFQKRWADLLSISPGERRVQYSSAELRERVDELFAAELPGWEAAVHHSPDVMIAASGPEAIRRGDYYFVMGEFHMGKNTLDSLTFLNQHPSPQDLVQYLAEDVHEPRVIPLLPRNMRIRGAQKCYLPTDYFLEFATGDAVDSRERVLPTGSLVVELVDDDLILRTRDGRLKFDIIEFFGFVLSNLMVNCFKNLRIHNHMPRVSIDRLVIYREWWCLSAAKIEWATENSAAALFIAVRRWARSHGMPRFVFVKTPTETKPFYVDFDSPIYVAMLAKSIRRVLEKNPDDAQITITEMLPEHDESWLPDAEGQRYTSELRVVAVDLSTRNNVPGRDNSFSAGEFRQNPLGPRALTLKSV